MDNCTKNLNSTQNNNKASYKNAKENKNTKNKDKVLVLNDQMHSNYLIVDLNRFVIKRVNKKEFSENQNPVLKWNNFSIKLAVGNRCQIRQIYPALNKMHQYEEEGLLGLIGGTYKFAKTFSGISYKLVSGDTDPETTALLLDASSLLLQHGTNTYNSWTPAYFLGFVARVYSILIRGKKQWEEFSAESLDGMLMMTGAIGLPDSFFSVLKKLNMITNRKIGDHPGLFLECIEGISYYLNSLLEKLDWLPTMVTVALRKIFSLEPYNIYYLI